MILLSKELSEMWVLVISKFIMDWPNEKTQREK